MHDLLTFRQEEVDPRLTMAIIIENVWNASLKAERIAPRKWQQWFLVLIELYPIVEDSMKNSSNSNGMILRFK